MLNKFTQHLQLKLESGGDQCINILVQIDHYRDISQYDRVVHELEKLLEYSNIKTIGQLMLI